MSSPIAIKSHLRPLFIKAQYNSRVSSGSGRQRRNSLKRAATSCGLLSLLITSFFPKLKSSFILKIRKNHYRVNKIGYTQSFMQPQRMNSSVYWFFLNLLDISGNFSAYAESNCLKFESKAMSRISGECRTLLII